MTDLKSRIDRASDADSDEVVKRLEAGEVPASLATTLGLDVIDLLALIARVGLGDETAEGPALIQVAPKHPRLQQALTDDALAGLFPRAQRPSRLALSAGLLQIVDFWDASHTAAQEADDLGEAATAAYWHLIAHRREPDPGNAQYWARRVGRHPIHSALVEAARPWLEASSDRTMSPGSPWSATNLIDLATRARPGSPQATLARRLQRLEMIYLLEESLRVAVSSDSG
jgi:hypothetical protein